MRDPGADPLASSWWVGRLPAENSSLLFGEVGNALVELGDFRTALPFYQRAVEEAEQGDVHGRVNHDSLKIIRGSLRKCKAKLG